MSELRLYDRFWSKVRKRGPEECWLWTASRTGAGYGQIWTSMVKGVRGRRLDAHRCSWELHYGKIEEGFHVLHKCDVKLCVNPSHLYLGTNSNNMQDALIRGQKPHGSKCSFAKLTSDQVQIARDKWNAGKAQQAIADELGVSVATIQRAVSGGAYKNVPFSIPHRKGHRNLHRKLSEETVKAIRTSSREFSNKRLAEMYQIGITTVHYIRTGEPWAHIR